MTIDTTKLRHPVATAASLAEAEEKQRAYVESRRAWQAPWGISPVGRATWAHRPRGNQVHDVRQKRLL